MRRLLAAAALWVCTGVQPPMDFGAEPNCVRWETRCVCDTDGSNCRWVNFCVQRRQQR